MAYLTLRFASCFFAQKKRYKSIELNHFINMADWRDALS